MKNKILGIAVVILGIMMMSGVMAITWCPIGGYHSSCMSFDPSCANWYIQLDTNLYALCWWMPMMHACPMSTSTRCYRTCEEDECTDEAQECDPSGSHYCVDKCDALQGKEWSYELDQCISLWEVIDYGSWQEFSHLTNRLPYICEPTSTGIKYYYQGVWTWLDNPTQADNSVLPNVKSPYYTCGENGLDVHVYERYINPSYMEGSCSYSQGVITITIEGVPKQYSSGCFKSGLSAEYTCKNSVTAKAVLTKDTSCA